MRRVPDEDGLGIDEARLQLHVKHVPKLEAVFGSLIQHTLEWCREVCEVAKEFLLVDALVIASHTWVGQAAVSRLSPNGQSLLQANLS